MNNRKEIRAAVLNAANEDFEIKTFWLDHPRTDEVLVKMVATGICQTDISGQRGSFPLPFPCVLGHEGAGIIEEVGQNVTGFAPGDSVVLSFDSCGTCANCSDNHVAYCDEFPRLNFSGVRTEDGSTTLHDDAGKPVHGNFFAQSSFATHCIASRRNVVKVNCDDVPLETLGPLGCGIQTGAGTILNVLQPSPTSVVAILGAGAVGFSALFAAKLLGCRTIVMVDRVDSRLDLATELGATHVINTEREKFSDKISAIGKIDSVVETTGVPALIETILPTLAVRGKIALLGAGSDSKIQIDIRDVFGGKVLTSVREGDCNPQTSIPQILEHVRDGLFPIDRITRFYDFSEINEAVNDANSGATIKPILRF